MARQIIVNSENKTVNVTVEPRGNIDLTVSRSISVTGVQRITAGNDLTVSNVAGNVTISFTPNGFTSTGNIVAPYFLGNVEGNISGNIVVPGQEGDILFNKSGSAGANNSLSYDETTSTLSVYGNLVALNVQGNGSQLSSLNAANIVGTVANATHAVTATSATTADTATSATTADTATSATTAGTVTTAAQPNITSVGTLSSLTVTSNVTAGNIKSDNLLYANGSPYQFTTNAAGTNTQVQFNNNGQFAANSNFTFNTTTGKVSATSFGGDGANLSNLNASNVVGTVNSATTAATVTTNAQPNITSVGTLTGLTIAGDIIPTTDVTYTLGNATNRFKDLYLSGNTIYLGVQSITTDENGIAMSGNISGDGSNLYNLPAANIVGDYPSITVTNDANVGGNLVIAGNLSVHGNTNYINVETLVIEDPIIEQGGGPNNEPLTTNDGKDRGELLHYYTTEPVDAFMGWKNITGEFIFGSNVTNTNEVISVNDYGNIRAQHVYANIDGANVVGEVANATYATTAGEAANATYATTAGSADSVQASNVEGNFPELVSDGNVTAGLTGYFIGNAAGLYSIPALAIDGAVPEATHATSADSAGSVPIEGVVGIGDVAQLNTDGNSSHFLNGQGSWVEVQTGGIPGGANTEIQFNDDGTFNGTSGLTFDKTTNNLTVTGNITGSMMFGDASGLYNIPGPGVVGSVANATYANTSNVSLYSNVTADTSTNQDFFLTFVSSTNGQVLKIDNDAAGNLRYRPSTNTLGVNSVVAANAITSVGNITGGNLITAGNATASRYTSTVATGTAPFTVTSTTRVANLNVTTAGVADSANSVTLANVSGIGNIAGINLDGNASHVLSGAGTWVEQSGGGGTATDLNAESLANVTIGGGSENQVISTDGLGTLSFVPLTSTLTIGTRLVAVDIGITNYTMNVETRSGNVTVNVN